MTPTPKQDSKRVKDYRSLMFALHENPESFKKHYKSKHLTEDDKKYAFWEAMVYNNKDVVFFILKEENPLTFLMNEYGNMSKVVDQITTTPHTYEEVLSEFYLSLPEKEQMSVLNASRRRRKWNLLEDLLDRVGPEKSLSFIDNDKTIERENPVLVQKVMLKAELASQISSSISLKKKM